MAGVIQENWKQPFSSGVKLGDFVGANTLLRYFVWKVLIANLRPAETIFYSSTHSQGPAASVFSVQFNSRVLGSSNVSHRLHGGITLSNAYTCNRVGLELITNQRRKCNYAARWCRSLRNTCNVARVLAYKTVYGAR